MNYKRLIIFVVVVSVLIYSLGYLRSVNPRNESDYKRSNITVPFVISNHVASETYTTTSSSESVLSLVQHTDIATYASTSQPVHLTERSPTLTQPPGPWKVLDTSSLSFPDFDGGSKCTDVICSNFVELSKSKCSSIFRSGVKPSCHFQDGTSNIRVSLLSYPGSGNTWTRQLLERSTGICTGSIYCDGTILKSGMIGEGVNAPSVLVVKTHMRLFKVNATIVILRNPIDTIESFYKWSQGSYKGKGAHTNNPPPSLFKNNARWKNFVLQHLEKWTAQLEKTLGSLYPRLIVKYEDMKENTSREVFRMLDFLHFNYSSDDVVKRLQNDEFGTFKRVNQDFDPYTPEQRQYVRDELKELITRLQENNHEFIIPTIQLYLSQI